MAAIGVGNDELFLARSLASAADFIRIRGAPVVGRWHGDIAAGPAFGSRHTFIVASQAGKSKLGYWQLFTAYSQREHGLRASETTGPPVQRFTRMRSSGKHPAWQLLGEAIMFRWLKS